MTKLALLGNRMSYLGRRALTGVVVLTAGFIACRENPADVAPTGDLAIELAVAEGVSLAQVDQVRVRLSSAGAADINFTLSSTSANQFEGTRQTLQPGTYTVTIRGITGGEVEFFGETTANVQVGVDATVNITLTSFEPAIDPISNTTSVNFTATWPAVIGAESYEVDASSDPTFQTFFAPDLVTDAGATISADFTVPGIGTYYVSVRAQRSGIETGITALQTAGVVNAVVPTATLVSSTIAAASDVKLFGVSAAGGEGMLVLAFQTGVSNIDLDVSIGPVDGVRVGGNHDMGAIGDNGSEWLLAYEYPSGPTPSRTSTTSQPANVVTLEPSATKPVTKTTTETVVARLQDLTAAAPAAPSAPAEAQTATDQRGIEVFGANGTTGDFDVFFNTCLATETGFGTVDSGTLADTDCFTFNPVSGNLTRGQFWVFDGIGGEMVDIQLTSIAFDPVLFLFGPDGSLVWYNDDFNGLDSRVVTTLPTDGMYIAFVATYDDLSIGAYGFTLDTFVGTNADGSTSTISATPDLIQADGVSTSTVTVQLNDGSGAAITTGGDVVSLETDLGSLSGLTDNADGTYTATLTAGTTGGITSIYGTVNGMDIQSSAIVALANPSSTADPATSMVAAAPSSIPADGVSWAGVRVQLKDAGGTNLTAGGDAVWLTTDAGTIDGVKDNGDGSYNAMLTSSTTVQAALVSGTLNGVAMTSNATVQFITPTSACSTIPTAIGASVGGSLDASDCDAPHRPGHFAEVWRFDAVAGQMTNIHVSATIDTYMFLLDTDGTTVLAENDDCTVGQLDPCLIGQEFATTGTYTIEVTSFTSGVTGDYGLNFAERAHPATSTITASPTSIPADGSSTATITVQGKGLGGGNVGAGGDAVTLSTTSGTIGAVAEPTTGVYTATLTAAATPGTATITGTMRGVAMTDDATITLIATATTVRTSFECALANYIVGAGLLGDELADGQTDPAYYDFDRRTMTGTGLAGTLDCDGTSGGIFTPLDGARKHADDLVAQIAAQGGGVRQDEEATAKAYGGYSLLLMGEGMCTASLDGGLSLTPADLWNLAATQFTDAVALAQAVGTVPNIVLLAMAGRARANLNLGNFISASADAAATAATGGQGFAVSATYDVTPFRRFNHVFDRVNNTGELTIEDDFRGLGDTRVPVTNSGGPAADGVTALWTQSKYIGLSTGIPITSWNEMKLIEAEAALKGGDIVGWLTILNQVRALGGLAALVDPGTLTAREDLMFDERSRWLFLESHHLGDKRRLISQYGRASAGLFTPTAGTTFKATATTYGSVDCFPQPQ